MLHPQQHQRCTLHPSRIACQILHAASTMSCRVVSWRVVSMLLFLFVLAGTRATRNFATAIHVLPEGVRQCVQGRTPQSYTGNLAGLGADADVTARCHHRGGGRLDLISNGMKACDPIRRARLVKLCKQAERIRSAWRAKLITMHSWSRAVGTAALAL